MKESANLLSLPIDVLLECFSYLECQDVCAVSRVCRTLWQICGKNSLWEALWNKLPASLVSNSFPEKSWGHHLQYKQLFQQLWHCGPHIVHRNSHNEQYAAIIITQTGVDFGLIDTHGIRVLESTNVALPKKHSRHCGRSALRFQRLKLETTRVYANKIVAMAHKLYCINQKALVTGVLVGSDKLVSIKLEAHIPKESPLFQKIITEVAVGSRKTTALNELAEKCKDKLSSLSFIQKQQLISMTFNDADKTEKATSIGIQETFTALHQGAVHTVLIPVGLEIIRYEVEDADGSNTVAFMDVKQEKEFLLELEGKKILGKHRIHNLSEYFKSHNVDTVHYVSPRYSLGDQLCIGMKMAGILRCNVHFSGSCEQWKGELRVAKNKLFSEIPEDEWIKNNYAKMNLPVLEDDLSARQNINVVSWKTSCSKDDFWKNHSHSPALLVDFPYPWMKSSLWKQELLNYGDVHLRVGTRETGPVSVKLKHFMEYMHQTKDDVPLYITDDMAKSPLNAILEKSDYCVPEYFSQNYYTMLTSQPPYKWISIGGARTGASFHKEDDGTAGWLALIMGKKLWMLFPPDAEIAENGVENGSEMSAMEWFTNIYPSLKLRKDCILAVQREGEVMYVPCGWYHVVLNVEETIAYGENFVNKWNCTQVATTLNKYDPNLLKRLEKVKGQFTM